VARMALRGIPRGNLTRQLRANIGGRHLGELSVEGPEGVDEILVLDCRETLQGRPRIDEYRRNPAGIGGAERFDRLIWRNCAGLERRQEASQACLSSFASNGKPAAPRLGPRFALYDRLCAVEEGAQILYGGRPAPVGFRGRAEPLQAGAKRSIGIEVLSRNLGSRLARLESFPCFAKRSEQRGACSRRILIEARQARDAFPKAARGSQQSFACGDIGAEPAPRRARGQRFRQLVELGALPSKPDQGLEVLFRCRNAAWADLQLRPHRLAKLAAREEPEQPELRFGSLSFGKP